MHIQQLVTALPDKGPIGAKEHPRLLVILEPLAPMKNGIMWTCGPVASFKDIGKTSGTMTHPRNSSIFEISMYSYCYLSAQQAVNITNRDLVSSRSANSSVAFLCSRVCNNYT